MRADSAVLGRAVLLVVMQFSAVSRGETGDEAVEVAVGAAHACARTARGRVVCWGDNHADQLGDGRRGYGGKPIELPALRGASGIVASGDQTCAVAGDGSMRCMGYPFGAAPVPIYGPAAPDEPAGSFSRHDVNCAIAADRSVRCRMFAQPDRYGRYLDVHGAGWMADRSYSVAGVSDARALGCEMALDGQGRLWRWNIYPGDSEPAGAVFMEGVAEIPTARSCGTFGCARTRDGFVACWGANQNGELGGGVRDSKAHAAPVRVPNVAGARQLEIGNAHACVLTERGRVWCWGGNYAGQAGRGDAGALPAPPAEVPGLSGVVKISAGYAHTCALDGERRVFCWGLGERGEVGAGELTRQEHERPVVVAGAAGVSAIALGDRYSCAVTGAGRVQCWGAPSSLHHYVYDRRGTLALRPGSGAALTTVQGHATARATPRPLDGLGDARQIVAANDGLYLVTKQRRASRVAILDDGSEIERPTIDVRVEPLPDFGDDVAELAVGARHECALTGAGSVRCRGTNDHGQLGDGSTTNRATAVLASGVDDAVEIGAGDGFTCARRRGGHVACWGENRAGQLGDGTFSERRRPAAVKDIDDAVQLSVGRFHSCVRRAGGGIACWGENQLGGLGDGTTIDRAVPTPVAQAGSFRDVKAGELFTCALRGDGGVACWGLDYRRRWSTRESHLETIRLLP